MSKRSKAKVGTADAPQARTPDSYANFIARVGQGTGNQGDGGHYGFNPVTRNRVQMEFVYRGSWVAGRVVDCVARDMTREGVDIKTSDKPEKIAELTKEFARLRIWPQLCETIKWSRLYGGACAFMMIDGQNPATPLRLETIRKDQFKGLLPMDRWLLNPSLQNLVSEYGPNFGKPVFYQTVSDAMGMPSMNIHHSRMIRLGGVELPYWQKIAENLWGQSVLERMWDRLLAFDSTTSGISQLVYKAHLRTLKIEGLREMIANNQAAAALKQLDMIRACQTNEGMTVLDSTDEFETHSYTFAGLDAVLIQFGEQLCGAVEIPAVRLFGQSPAGFNSGDSDLRSYYDTIKQNQVSDLGPGVETLYKVGYISTFGAEPPKVFEIEFEHLWQMSEEQKADVTQKTSSAIMEAFEKQAIDRATAMRELKELSTTVGTFAQIDDKAITEAENDPAPTPEALGLEIPEAPVQPGGAAGEKPEKDPNEYKPNDAKPFKALDAAGEVPPRHEESGRFTHGMGLDPKRFDEKGKKDDDGEWAENPLDPVKSKSMREAIQAAHPHTCKAYGTLGEIEAWKLQGSQKLVNIKKVGEYRKDHGEPITVVKRSGEHGIVDGHHRAVAAHLQNRTVAANIIDMDKAFAEAADHEASNPGLGILGGLHLATELRLRNAPPPKRTKDSILRRLLQLLKFDDEAAWNESQHPRQPDGKFGTKGASSWKKIGEKKGSNEGGTYELTDSATGGSKKYYVKFPKDMNQALTEVMSARIAQGFGIATTQPDIVMIDGKTAVASELRTLMKPNWGHSEMIANLGPQQGVQLAKMYYVAKATKNWDVLGVDLSNIMIDVSGNLVQMDTGGSFEFRAQGKHKDYGVDPNDTDLLNESLPAGKVFGALMKHNPAAFTQARKDLSMMNAPEVEAAFNNSGLPNASTLKSNFMQRFEALKKVPVLVTSWE